MKMSRRRWSRTWIQAAISGSQLVVKARGECLRFAIIAIFISPDLASTARNGTHEGFENKAQSIAGVPNGGNRLFSFREHSPVNAIDENNAWKRIARMPIYNVKRFGGTKKELASSLHAYNKFNV